MREIVADQPSLAECEAIIERGMATFIEVGNALLTIRDSRLYKGTHGTFEDYCRERWAFSRSRAYRLIAAAEVVGILSPIGDTPATESVVRTLVGLEPEIAREVWAEANTGGPPTAAKVDAIVKRSMPSAMASSTSPEWYTPAHIVALAAEVLGGIDVDPCSNSREAPNVTAREHFTQADDGLSRAWCGAVYMNPPYGSEIGDWVTKLRAEYEAARVTAAIALVPARVDTQWWQIVRDYPVCFVTGRLKFVGAENCAPFPSALVYLGPYSDDFVAAFSTIGDVWRRVPASGGAS